MNDTHQSTNKLTTQSKLSLQKQLLNKQLFVHPLLILQKQGKQQVQHGANDKMHHQYQHQHQFQYVQPGILQLNDQQDTSNKILGKNKNIKKDKKTIVLSTSSAALNSNNKVQNYRTRMCPDGIQCRKRLTCNFAHNQFQLRRPFKNRKNPCARYQKGLCSRGAACPDYHGNIDLKKKNYRYKTLKCKQWAQKGTCQKGKLCIFIHDQDIVLESYGQEIQEKQVENNKCQTFESNFIDNFIDNVDNYNQKQIIRSEHQQQMFIEQLQKNGIQQLKSNNGIEQNKKQKIVDIFNSLNKQKANIVVKQVIQQQIVAQLENNHKDQQQIIDEGFNIQFTF